MRIVALVSWLVLLGAGCAPVAKPAPSAPVDRSPVVRNTRPQAIPEVSPPQAEENLRPPEPARVTKREIGQVVFEGVAFDSRSHCLEVVDQPGGPASRFPDAAAAGRSRGALAAVNAGFFTPVGEPLGLVVSNGERAGSWNSASSLGSGVWFETPSGKPAISRRERIGKIRAAAMRETIQAGPMLVENGRAVAGLDPVKASVRTMILWDGGTRWWIGRASACSLAELGAALGRGKPADWPVRYALNLDGGRSSDLWISEQVPGGPVTRRSAWNRPVRNFLILKLR